MNTLTMTTLLTTTTSLYRGGCEAVIAAPASHKALL